MSSPWSNVENVNMDSQAILEDDVIEDLLNNSSGSDSDSSGGSDIVCELSDDENFSDSNNSDDEDDVRPINSNVMNGGGDGVRPRPRSRNAQNQQQTLNWTNNLLYYVPDDFFGNKGPVHHLDPGSNELDYFEYMLGGNIFYQQLVDNTNSYAEHKQNVANKIDKAWWPTSVEEMKAYLGVLIYMGVFDLPDTSDYWLSPDIDCPLIKNCMTYKRYKQITRYFHVSDIASEKKAGEDGYDMLQKVRPMMDILENFHLKYNPGRELAVDKAMVPFKGRHCIKQYMKDKPHK